jgi:hypothetical protein
MLKEGYSPTMDQCFYDFRLYSLTVLGRGQYSTMVEMPYAGEVYALSLDFSNEHLTKILSHAAPTLRNILESELALDPVTPRTIDFDGEISFGVRARLGQIQRAEEESFVPLVAQEIF